MRPIDVHHAVNNLWKTLPVGLGEDFNTVLKYLEHIEAEKERRNRK